MADTPTVVEAWSAVMEDVQAIKKGERNKAQGFNFRGIDTVMNAVGPVLRKHRVVVLPAPDDITLSTYQTDKGTTMHSAVVKMRYFVQGPAGDVLIGGAYGEAADAGDKAVSKAQSVAYRVFLLQGLTIPTDEPDPDSEAHQRAAMHKLDEVARSLNANERGLVKAWCAQHGMPTLSAMSDAEKDKTLEWIEQQGWL